ncbi:vgr related protein [alpha proteobacterium AAP81b]|nr:vgr related protein [alpha proteobacterium AAP81b]
MTDRVRPLTAGEVALVAATFGDAIDPAPVTVRRAKFWAFHPWWVTMAPDGHLWFHPNGFDWRADFSAASLGFQAHFLHEMTHVWQVQTGGSLVTRRLPLARYGYRLVPGKAFAAYGLEQQACIVADAFLLAQGRDLPGRAALADYRAVLPFTPG